MQLVQLTIVLIRMLLLVLLLLLLLTERLKDPDESAKKRDEEAKRLKNYRENTMSCAHDRSAVSAAFSKYFTVTPAVKSTLGIPVSSSSVVELVSV